MSQTRQERRLNERRVAATHTSQGPCSVPKARYSWPISLLIGMVALTAGILGTYTGDRISGSVLVAPTVQKFSTVHSGLSLGKLLEMSPAQLAEVDIAEANLLCANGLPGHENLDIAAKLKQIDEWADRVDSETRRNFHRFKSDPAEYENSEIYYRMGMLVTVLQQDFGVHYNSNLIDVPPDKIDDAFLSDPTNMFLTGLLGEKRMGTCSSMPVLYVAIGRRLGYPVTLVNAKDHLFVRWQRSVGDTHENIEATGHGLAFHPDEFYKNWRGISEAEIKTGVCLKSLTCVQELALLMQTRGGALQFHHRFSEAAVAMAHASLLWPENRVFRTLLAEVGVKLAPWQFTEIRSGNLPPAAGFDIPAQLTPEISSLQILRSIYPESNWGAIYRQHHNPMLP